MSTLVLWQLHPVPTIHNDSKSNPLLLRTPTIPRKCPRKRKTADKIADKIVAIDSISKRNSPENFTFKRLDNSVQLFHLWCNEVTVILAVHECISVNRNLYDRSSYHGLVTPLP